VKIPSFKSLNKKKIKRKEKKEEFRPSLGAELGSPSSKAGD